MRIRDVSLPEVYTESSDFRFFLKWFENALSRIQFDTENLFDLYDPLRCKSELLWMLGDTVGYKFDERLPTAFNRLVILYFMSMIRNKGSKDGVTLAAEVNLAQFGILESGKENDILHDRLEDTSVPVNSVYVTPHTAEGYIDVVYFSAKKPVDACLEYVRPLGMYLFQSAGVRYDSRTKISIDARLTNTHDLGVSIGPTHVGHYRRDDYARMQRTQLTTEIDPDEDDGLAKSFRANTSSGPQTVVKDGQEYVTYKKEKYTKQVQSNFGDERNNVYYRNKKYEGDPDPNVNPGYRALYSLQLANNEHVVKALLDPTTGASIDPIFSIGYGPQKSADTYPAAPEEPLYKRVAPDDVLVENPKNYLKKSDEPTWNLRYHRSLEESISKDVYTVDADRTKGVLNPRPAVNPIMATMGEAISLNPQNTAYTKANDDGEIVKVDVAEDD